MRLNSGVRASISACRASLFAAILFASPAFAGSNTTRIVIPAGSIAEALAQISRQSGASIGYLGRLPHVRLKAFQAALAHEALDQIAKQAGLRLVVVDARHFRLEQLPPSPAVVPSLPLPVQPAEPPQQQDIVVTGTKRDAVLGDIPLSVTVLSSAALEYRAGQSGTDDIVAQVSSMTSTNMGPGRNRIFIRGVADSAFNGPTQSTIGIYLGEARVNFDTPDPNLRLIDVERIEILKGPQGALYGSGVLGGVYRIVPKSPESNATSAVLTSHFGGTAHGGFNTALDAILNLPVTDNFATRLVAYVDDMSGWIDDRQRQSVDVNSVRTKGGRLSSRWSTHDIEISTSFTGQWTRARDSQYATEETGPYARSTQLAEPHKNNFLSGQIAVSLPLGAFHATLTSAHVHHDIANQFDASDAAGRFKTLAPLTYQEDRGQNLTTNEVRLSDGSGTFQWLLGVNQLSAASRLAASFTSTEQHIPLTNYRKSYQEYAAFGDASIAITPTLRAQAGLRIFKSMNEERRQNDDDSEAGSTWRANPSASVSWKPAPNSLFWLGYSTATRSGGLNPSASEEPFTFKADHLTNIEAGMRLTNIADKLSIEAAAFHFNWTDLQSDILLSSGLLGSINAGRAHNVGIEVAAKWVDPNWLAEVSTTVQFGDVYSANAALGPIKDGRLPTVPRIRGHARIERRAAFLSEGSWVGLTVQASGPSHLSFDPRLDRKTSSFALIGAYLRTDWHSSRLGLACDNILNSEADSFAFGNPFSTLTRHQRTPVRPRTCTLSIQHHF